MTALESALTTALIDFAWQGVLIACVLWITLFLLRNQSASTRYVASCLALLAMAATPVVTAYLAYHPVTAGPPIPAMPISADVAAATQKATATPFWIEAWVLPAWSLGVLLFSLRLIWGCCQLSALKRRGTPLPDAIRHAVDNLAARTGLKRKIRVLLSTLTETPGIVGFLRPVILLPISSLSGLTPQQLEVILAHEMAHIRRYDHLVNAVQILIETLLFYHPAVWWTSTRIRHERELCCDDLALRWCDDALCYARALTALEKLRGVPMLAIGSTSGPLLYRIRRIMGERPSEYNPSKLSSLLALVLALTCIAVNVGTRMKAQEQPPTPPTIYESPGVKADTAGAQVVEPIRYPRSAAEKAIQGTVVVQLDVDAQGNVTDARVLSGPPELRKVVLHSVLSWRFKPEGTASTRQISVAFQVPPLQELNAQQKYDDEKRAAARQAAERSEMEQQQRVREMRALESEQAEQQAKLKQLADAGADSAPAQSALLAKEEALEAVQAQRLDLARQAQSRPQPSPPGAMAGRVLARIDVSGLSEEQRDQLIGQLPVRIGETLSREAIERLHPAIRGFDERLRYEIVPLENNQALLKVAAVLYTLDEQAAKDKVSSEMRSRIEMLKKRLAELERSEAEHPNDPAREAQIQQVRAQLDLQLDLMKMQESALR